MKKLFEPSIINGMTLKNRFVRSATWEGMAKDDGTCTPGIVDLMVSLAKGGVGLIITGHAYVRRDGQASPRQLGVYKDELISGLEKMTRAVHEKDGKIVMQLAHAGFHALGELTGQPPISPSAVEIQSKLAPKEMTVQDIKEIIQAFAQAAERAKNAGFDGVQIHAAHGYLLSQFLSPVYNHRTDAYGGDIHNRARALLEVFQAIRKAVGPDYPVLVKLNTRDFVENGLKLEDSLQVGSMLSQEGADAIELSGGLPTTLKLGPIRRGIKSEDREAYFREEARAFKGKIQVPLILVGGIRSYHVAEELVDTGVADYISMSRPFIREPALINRWLAGDLRKAACISDNQCFIPASAGEGIYCVNEKKENNPH
ncbi:MAG: NADH:flavin oxidoreductase [Syntrophales bacterium]|nr:NADH:flavin oxidoreductase [Syntrophales bacterium]